MENKYRVARGDPVADRERILDLWARCGFASGEQARARYEWFYLQNPRGRGRVYLLSQHDELVGAVGAGSRRFACGPGEAPLDAAILVDFVVHPAHRSMFPALQLQRFVREEELRNTEMVYGLPDVKAAPVFRRLGATAELVSGSFVRVMRSGFYTRRLFPKVPAAFLDFASAIVDRARIVVVWAVCRARGLRTEWQRGIPETLDTLWAQTSARANLATGERDSRFLRWRFGSGDWRVLTVKQRQSVVGYFVCLQESGELLVFDLLVVERDAAALPLLALSLAAWTLGSRTVRVVFGGFRALKGALARAGFRLRDTRPCFLMQQPAATRRLPAEWWLTRADEDV